jgi:hypothetical protein
VVSGGRGLGDRWLAGELVPNVAFALHDSVWVHEGRHAGRGGRVLLLLDASADPLYLVALDGVGHGVRLRQSTLRPAH